MTDIRRTVLWMVFTASLFLIWNAWNVHNGQSSFFAPTAPKPAAQPLGAATPPRDPAAARAAGAGVPGAPGTAPVLPAAPERTTVETDVVRATLSGDGGSVVRLELLGYPDAPTREWYEPLLELLGRTPPPVTAPTPIVLLDESANRFYVAESGLVPAAGGAGLPNHHTPMTLLPGPRQLAGGRDALQVRFESAPVGGVKLAKTYTFHRGSYLIDLKNEVINDSAAPVAPRLYLQLVRDGIAPPGGGTGYSTFAGPAIDDGKSYQKIDFKSIDKRGPNGKEDHTTSADAGWIAMVQHYFASIWLIDRGNGALQPREYFTGKADLVNPSTGQPTHVYSVGMLVPLGEIAPGATKSFDARLFVGPQREEELETLDSGHRLPLLKDYGIFKIIAEPLFWLLTRLHNLFGNWGWSIIGLVVVLKIAFYWLNARAYASMARMKAVNPRIQEMRERLKDKPQQMQQEMMKIYREEKINPLGGCLPIFIQMPVFLALYWVLLSTVEMRGAPWIGWIHDLSTPDPYFILPFLMMLTSLAQTWLNPTPADPMQAKMMWFMPLIFSALFFVFPSGLVLYYLTNNLLTIAQQYVINKRLGVLGK